VDKRTSARSRVLKVGTIEFEGGSINCMVRNLSKAGAALDVVKPQDIPERFTLILLADGLRLPGNVVWRKGKRIGVAFE
jgi:hypothetical protein